MSFFKSNIGVETISEIEDETGAGAEAGATDNTAGGDEGGATGGAGEGGDPSAANNPDMGAGEVTNNGEETNPDDAGADAAAAAADAGAAGDENAELNEEAQAAAADGEAVEVELDKEEALAQECLELCAELNSTAGVAMALEGIGEYVSASMKAGSYNYLSATQVNKMVTRELSHLKLQNNAIAAMEADASDDAKVGVAAQNQSAIASMYTRLKEGAMSALEKVVNYVKERMERLFTATGRMKARISALEKHLSNSETAATDVNSVRLFNAINVNGSVDKAFDSLKLATQTVVYFSQENTSKPMLDIVSSLEKPSSAAVQYAETRLKKLKSNWCSKLREKNLIKEDGWASTEVLPGNVVFGVFVPESMEQMGDLGSTVQRVEAGAAQAEAVVKAASIQEYKGYIAQIKSGINAIEGARNSDIMKSLQRGFANLADWSKAKDDANAGIIRATWNAVIRMITASAKAPHMVFAAGYLQIASTYLDYITMSTRFGYVTGAVDTTANAVNKAGSAVAGAASSAAGSIASATAPARQAAANAAGAVKNAASNAYGAAKGAFSK